MSWDLIHSGLVFIQRCVSTVGILIIVSGVLLGLYQYGSFMIKGELVKEGKRLNTVRLSLGRILILGLEFIVAADLIGTTTTPDYYSVGLLAIIVCIRTLLSYSISREMIALSREK